jgi:hypothetical protein
VNQKCGASALPAGTEISSEKERASVQDATTGAPTPFRSRLATGTERDAGFRFEPAMEQRSGVGKSKSPAAEHLPHAQNENAVRWDGGSRSAIRRKFRPLTESQ